MSIDDKRESTGKFGVIVPLQKDLKSFLAEKEIKENKLLSGFGYFLLKFERIFDVIRTIITEIIKKNGLEEERYIDILLYETTAGPLGNYYRAVMFEYYHKSEEWEKINKFNTEFHEKLKQAITIRNFLMHADYNMSTYKHERLFGKRFEVDKKTGELKNKFEYSTSFETFENWNQSLLNLLAMIKTIEFNLINGFPILNDVNIDDFKNVKFAWLKNDEENHRGKKKESRKAAARIKNG